MDFRADQIERHAIAQHLLAIAEQVQARRDGTEALAQLAQAVLSHLRWFSRRRQQRHRVDAQVVGLRQLSGARVVGVMDEARNFAEAGRMRGCQAFPPGDQIESAAAGPHQNGLQDAMGLNRSHEQIES
jgi:hypothetical protein